MFIVEGPRLVRRAVGAGLMPIEMYEDGSTGLDWAGAVTVSPAVLDKASYRSSSQGVIAVFHHLPTDLGTIIPSRPALVLVAENVEKPGNVGAILRTAAAVGADGVVAVDEGTDFFNPNVVRASTGALFTTPIARCEIGQLNRWLFANSIALVAADPSSRRPYWETDLVSSCALLVGSEHAGLSPAALGIADAAVSIPMRDGVDSLNASVALALLAFESLRQRSVAGH